jgi:hypothetical protein
MPKVTNDPPQSEETFFWCNGDTGKQIQWLRDELTSRRCNQSVITAFTAETQYASKPVFMLSFLKQILGNACNFENLARAKALAQNRNHQKQFLAETFAPFAVSDQDMFHKAAFDKARNEANACADNGNRDAERVWLRAVDAAVRAGFEFDLDKLESRKLARRLNEQPDFRKEFLDNLTLFSKDQPDSLGNTIAGIAASAAAFEKAPVTPEFEAAKKALKQTVDKGNASTEADWWDTVNKLKKVGWQNEAYANEIKRKSLDETLGLARSKESSRYRREFIDFSWGREAMVEVLLLVGCILKKLPQDRSTCCTLRAALCYYLTPDESSSFGDDDDWIVLAGVASRAELAALNTSTTVSALKPYYAPFGTSIAPSSTYALASRLALLLLADCNLTTRQPAYNHTLLWLTLAPKEHGVRESAREWLLQTVQGVCADGSAPIEADEMRKIRSEYTYSDEWKSGARTAAAKLSDRLAKIPNGRELKALQGHVAGLLKCSVTSLPVVIGLVTKTALVIAQETLKKHELTPEYSDIFPDCLLKEPICSRAYSSARAKRELTAAEDVVKTLSAITIMVSGSANVPIVAQCVLIYRRPNGDKREAFKTFEKGTLFDPATVERIRSCAPSASAERALLEHLFVLPITYPIKKYFFSVPNKKDLPTDWPGPFAMSQALFFLCNRKNLAGRNFFAEIWCPLVKGETVLRDSAFFGKVS